VIAEMQFMLKVPFEEFLATLLCRFIDESKSNDTKYHYVCTNPDQARELYNGFTQLTFSQLEVANVQLRYITTANGKKIIVMLHDGAEEKADTYHEDFIARIRDELNNLDNTVLLVIHNSSLETILTTCKDLSIENRAFSPNSVQNELQRLSENHPFIKIVNVFIERKQKSIKDQNLSVFGYKSLYKTIVNNSLNYKEESLFSDPRLSDNDNSRQIKGDIERNARLYQTITNKVNDCVDDYNNLVAELEEIGLGEKFIRDNFLNKKVNWRDIDYRVIEAEIITNKTKKLDLTAIDFNGAKLETWKRATEEGDKRKIITVLIETQPGNIELKFRMKAGDPQLKVEQVKTSGDFKTHQINIKTSNHEKQSVLTTNVFFNGDTQFLQIKFKRPSAKENFQFNCLFVEKGQFNISNYFEKVTVEIKRSKGVLLIENIADELILNPEITEVFVVQSNDKHIDCESYGRLSFKSLLEQDVSGDFDFKFKERLLPVKIAGAVSLDSIKLPSLLDKHRSSNIFDAERNPKYNSTTKRVIVAGKEKELSVEAKLLCATERRYIADRLLFLNEQEQDEINTVDLLAKFEGIAEKYNNLYEWLDKNETLISLTNWPEELCLIITGLLELINAKLEEITDGSLSEANRVLLKVGSYKKEGKEWFTPFHPLCLAYSLQLVQTLKKYENNALVDIPQTTLDKLNPEGLIPVLFDDTYGYSYSVAHPQNKFWLEVVPQKHNNHSFVAKLVNEKIIDFTTCFDMLFRQNSNAPLLINSINNQSNSQIFTGLVTYLKKNKTKSKSIHICIYDDEMYETSFDVFSESKNIESIRALVKISGKEKPAETDELIALFRNKVTYSKFTDITDYDYAHLCFFKNNERVSLKETNVNSAKTGIACQGLISGEASYLENRNYYTGFGLENLQETNVLIKLASNYNQLLRPARDKTSRYIKGVVPVLSVQDNFRDKLANSYQSSIWTCIIEPKVTLDFFNDEETILIHYSDQYTNSISYDAITVSSRIGLYKGLLKDDSDELIKSFNAISGQWLLDIVKESGKPKKSNTEKQIKEKQGIVAAYKFVSTLLIQSDITWVPLSVGEMLRVTGSVGLEIKENDFSARLHNKRKGALCDDILFVGFKCENIFLLPLEVKSREKGTDFTKAVAQAKELSSHMKRLLAPSTFKAQIFRSLFIQQIMSQIEKFELYDVFPKNYFLSIKENRETLQQGNYSIKELSNYPQGIALAINNSVESAGLDCDIDNIENILKLRLPDGLKSILQKLPIAKLTEKLINNTNYPELTPYVLYNSEFRDVTLEDTIDENQAIDTDDLTTNEVIKETTEIAVSFTAQFYYPPEYEHFISKLLKVTSCDLQLEDILGLTENDISQLVDFEDHDILDFYRLNEYLIKSVVVTTDKADCTNNEETKDHSLQLNVLNISQEYVALANVIKSNFGQEITVADVQVITQEQLTNIEGFGKLKLIKFKEFVEQLKNNNFSEKMIPESFIPLQDFDMSLAELEQYITTSLDDYLSTGKTRETSIFVRRLGLDCQSETLEEIGQDFSVTRERIRQIESKAKRNFLSQLKVAQNVIWAITKSNLSELRDPLYPNLRTRFTGNNNFYAFLELCCGLKENEIKLITTPQINRTVFNEYWTIHQSPSNLESLTWYLHENLNIEIVVAENQILRWAEAGIVRLNDELVEPLSLPKVEALTNALLDMPSGSTWENIQKLAIEKKITQAEITLERLEGSLLTASDRELIYQCARGTYRHLDFLELSTDDINNILVMIKTKLEDYKVNGRNSVNLSVDIFKQERFAYDYYVVRHAVRTYGESEGIFFNGKSGADTVSLDNNFSLASQKTVLVEVFKSALKPLNKKDVASKIRSQSLGHASFYLDKLQTEGEIVRVDETHYAHIDNAFKNFDIEQVIKKAIEFISQEQRVIEGEKIQTFLNRNLALESNKYFYLSMLKIHSKNYGVDYDFVQNLVSSSPINNAGLADFCRDALQQTTNNAEALEHVQQYVCAHDHVIKRCFHQVYAGRKPENAKVSIIEQQPNVDIQVVDETKDVQIAPQQAQSTDTLKVLIGHDIRNEAPILWEPTNTAKFMNTNSGIIGTMGTGKTQCTKSVVTQLYRNQHNNVDGKPIGILIFDYKSDYVDDKFMQVTNGKKFNLHKLPYNPLSLFGDTPMLPVHTARGFSETMGKAFGLGQKQQLRLRKLISEAYELAGIHKSDKSTWSKPAPTIADVWALFEESDPTEDSLYAALESLYELEIFEDNIAMCTSLYELVDGVTVIELAGYPGEIQNLVVALTLDLFYSQMQKQGKPQVQGDFRQVTKLLLVDEADNFMSQNFPSLRKVLKEGREYGVGVILSTQDITHFKTSENDYSAYILSWIVHRVGQIKNQDIKSIFNKDDKADQDQLMKTIRELDKHYSLYVDGDKKITKIKDKAFWELVERI